MGIPYGQVTLLFLRIPLSLFPVKHLKFSQQVFFRRINGWAFVEGLSILYFVRNTRPDPNN